MHRYKKAILAIGLSILAMGAQAASNLVSNGDFSLPNTKTPPSDERYYWGSQSGTDSIFSSDAHPGLNGTGSALIPGSDWIYQTITFASGASYSLSFTAAGTDVQNGIFAFDANLGGPSDRVKTNGTTGEIAFYEGYNSFSLTTTGLKTDGNFTAKLWIGGAEGGTWNIDNVSITASVPEPESWAMLLVGLTAVGGLARRRKAGQVTG